METSSNTKEGNEFLNLENGPEENELSGLKSEERKRQRIEAHEFSDTTLINQHAHKGSVLSHNDCSEPPPLIWLSLGCKLASHNELSRMELSRSWELSHSSCSW